MGKLKTFNPALRGNCTPNQKLPCFVPYFKIIDTFLNNNLCVTLEKPNPNPNPKLTLTLRLVGCEVYSKASDS